MSQPVTPVHRRSSRARLAALGLVLAAANAAAQSTLFVDASAPAGGDGTSWSTAFDDLQDGLDAARLDPLVASIHVAQGLYRPDRGTLDATLSFELVDGVALLGGFPSGGGPLPSRDPVLHATILSGDLLGDDGPPDAIGQFPGASDNSHHVVRAVEVGSATRLDGFFIRSGVAPSVGGRAACGANVLIEGGAPVIEQCLLELGWVEASGGGLAAFDSAVSLIDCTFSRNRAPARGGGAALLGTVAGLVEGCVFEANLGGSGCGLAIAPESFLGILGSDSTVSDCLFVRNRGVLGANGGGGLFLRGARPHVARCTFLDNEANGGGGLFVSEGSARVEVCLFRGNDAQGDGGGAVSVTSFQNPVGIPATELLSCSMVGNNGAIVAVGLDVLAVNCTLADNTLPDVPPFVTWPAVFGQDAGITLRNGIVWGNAPQGAQGDERDHLVGILGTSYLVQDSIVEDWAGVLPGSALGLDPLFQDPLGPDGDPATVADNVYRLRAASPAVDSGDPAALPGPFPLDVQGLLRVVDGNRDGLAVIDMGAYERPPSGFRWLRRQTSPPGPVRSR